MEQAASQKPETVPRKLSETDVLLLRAAREGGMFGTRVTIGERAAPKGETLESVRDAFYRLQDAGYLTLDNAYRLQILDKGDQHLQDQEASSDQVSMEQILGAQALHQSDES